jgi:16S rRNA (adenine1518-N6/adenine1519-N6)-dimethyltransferase
VRAKKSLGQNFLVDARVAKKIVDALGPIDDSTVIEIGPGHGALTRHLVGSAGAVYGIELDSELLPALKDQFGSDASFHPIHGDALAIDICSLNASAGSMMVVANLPYYISTAVLQRLIEQRDCLSQLVLMLQREVVSRITASPGNSERGYLSVLVQACCTVECLFDVPPAAFRPIPKVWSSVIRIRFSPRPWLADDEGVFKLLVSSCFAQKRKTILNNLKGGPPRLQVLLEAAGGIDALLHNAAVDPRARAEMLDLDDWGRMVSVLRQS